jgi:diguanylate cyclase (GGDEF)-like protein
MKLSQKLVIPMFAAVMISLTVVVSFQYIRAERDVYSEIDTSITAQIRAVYSTAASAAFANSEELSYNVVEGLTKYEAVKCAELVLPDKNYRSGRGCRGTPDYSRALVSWWSDAENLGKLNIYVDEAVPRSKINEYLFEAIIRAFGFVVMIVLVLTFFARRVVTRRIERLSAKISAIEFNEDFELLSEGGDNDEIGTIARVINQLALYAQKHIISEKIQSSKMQELSSQMRLVFEMSSSGIVITDKNLCIKQYNPKFKSWLSSVCPDEESIQNSSGWLDCFSDEPDAVRAKIIENEHYDIPSFIELKATRSCRFTNNEEYYMLAYTKGRIDEHDESIVFYLRDETEAKQQLKKTEYEANHDSLTELHNRLAATRHARHVFSSLDGDTTSALIFIDLDAFKPVNDTYGHDAGDELLRVISYRIKAQLRKTDIAARWGGDEFMVLLEEADANEAIHVAKKLQKEIQKPIFVESDAVHSVSVGASIGIAIADENTRDFPTVLDYADRAMYDVKKTTKNGIRLYCAEDFQT